jgi:pilus assembly protein Flp/PilA
MSEQTHTTDLNQTGKIGPPDRPRIQTQKEIRKMSLLKKLFTEEEGQDMVEYGLVIAIVVIGAVTLLGAFKTSLSTAFGAIGGDVTTNIK